MHKIQSKNILQAVFKSANYIGFFSVFMFLSFARASGAASLYPPPDTASKATLRYKLEPKNNYPFSTSGVVSPLLMPPPANIEQKVVYDPKTNSYQLNEKIGSLNYRNPAEMSFEEYKRYQAAQTKTQYWQEKSKEESGAGPSFLKGLRLGNQNIDRVFGSEGITITPQGSAELKLGYAINVNENPSIPLRNRRNGSFIFKEKIMMNVTGSIGDKMEVGLNYNTEATFDFENKTKLEYSGKEDEIIKKIEAGDVSFGLPGTLITGSQSLFGIKTELQFGRLTVSNIFSHQRSQSSSVSVQGGAQKTEFEVDIDQYDINRHFFLSHFFRDNYNDWLKNLPQIESQMRIEEIEVWVANKQANYTESRDIVAIMDLAEGFGPGMVPNFQATGFILTDGKANMPAENRLNNLYERITNDNNIRSITTAGNVFASLGSGGYVFSSGSDYIYLENARPLSSREYTVNRELGYISLNSPLRNDEILAVAFTYTYKGQKYFVGELARDIEVPGAIIVKLLKGTTQTPKFKNWDLMMKNIYSIGAYQLSNEDFVLDILYRNDKTGVSTNYITERPEDLPASVYEKTLNSILRLDNLDSRNEPYPDGIFDFIEGVTVNSRNGRIIFPVVEPFGSHLYDTLTNSSENALWKKTAQKYVFNELYDSTQTKAQQIAEKNKFVIRGQYKSSGGSDIQLNAMNIPRGSVKVMAGGRELQENIDYTVDYTLGRVKIINQGIAEAGTPIQVKLESNSMFSMQTKSMIGTHLDYKFSENFNLGGTVLRLSERPLTNKVNIGDEPISNTIWGLNTSYRAETQLLTTWIDKLPFIETKEKSSIALEAEFAHLIPGQSKMIDESGKGIAYIDDFEGAQTKIDLKSVTLWHLSSPPVDNRFTNFYSSAQPGIQSGYGRAKLAWYVIDPLFYGTSSYKPDGIDASGHDVRIVRQKEIFPNKDEDYLDYESHLSVLNLNFYPQARGPYNFDPSGAGGVLPLPGLRWGGIMREIISTDFEASNIEFIEFWLMDPFVEDEGNQGGDLYFHLGEISEDILRDNRKSFENGLPVSNDLSDVVVNEWGHIPTGKMLVNGFSGGEAERRYQDVGLDGLNDAVEREFFPQFSGFDDPAGDNYDYFLDNKFDATDSDIKTRYLNYNGMENNSPASTNANEENRGNKTTPDVEDINRDNTLNTSETYYQYKVSLRKDDFEIGSNYIVDKITGRENGDGVKADWYQFKIPVDDYEAKIGNIEDFKSIRFVRLMLHGFESPVVLRFATLDLVRGEWRRYKRDIYQSSPTITEDLSGTSFEVSSVNIEENGNKLPVNYILPPGIDRVTDPNQPQVKQLNEQSLLLKVTDLQDNDGRAVFKTTQLDLRQYKNLEMFVHAEALTANPEFIDNFEITAIVRIGSDYQNNYYEIEVPLVLTPHLAPGTKYNGQDVNHQRTVWPELNTVKIDLQSLVDLKIERNKAVEENPNFISYQTIYTREVEKPDNSVTAYNSVKKVPNLIKIKGYPNLSNIRQIMIGVRNPGDESKIYNDGAPKSAEVWFNELRLTEFNNKGGWAANGQVQAKLADLGIVSVAGAHSTPGFGSVEQTLEERQKEEINQVDVSTNLELGKFFPEQAKVSVPLYMGYSNTTINPEYYPKDPDVTLKEALRLAKTSEERDQIKKASRDVTERKSVNLTNVRWNKQFKKVQVLSPSNLSGTVVFSETKMQNYSVDYNRQLKYGANINYVYNARPKTVSPLEKWKVVKSPSLKIIRDFNFTYQPSAFTFGTKLDRTYQTMKLRNVYDDVDMLIEPTTSKGLYWDRNYTLRWDLAKSLKFNYSASNHAIIDEPLGPSDLFERDQREMWRDSVWANVMSGGRNLQFNQNYGFDYTLPINKIPIFNWTNFKATYDVTYSWTRGPLLADETRNLGNSLKNSNSVKLTGTFNMKNLYSKVPYLKNLDTKYGPNQRKKPEDIRYKTVEYSKRTFFKKDSPKSVVHKLGSQDVTVKVIDENGQEISIKTTIENENKITVETGQDITGATVIVEAKIEKGENPLIFISDNALRTIMGFKNITLNYTKTSSTKLPGYLPETSMFGFDLDGFYGAPGYPFVLGMQDDDILYKARDNQWLTNDEYFSEATVFAVNESFNYRATYEPFKGLRVDFTGMRTHVHTTEQDFYPFLNDSIGNRYRGGNFSLSLITLASAFEKIDSSTNWQSVYYNKFKANRSIISARLNRKKFGENQQYTPGLSGAGIEPGFSDGYSSTSSEVLIYSFLSAYTGANPKNSTLEMFPWAVLPNWKLTFDGLSQLSFIQKFLKDISLTHSYKSTYNIGSYGTNVSYFQSTDPNSPFYEGSTIGLIRDMRNNIIAQFTPNSISLKEELSPLIGFNMTWHNSLLTKFEFGKTRLLSLSMNNSQLTESRNNDFVIGAGYKIKDVPLNITTAGGTKNIKSDLNVRMDFSIRDNITILRSLSETSEGVVSTGARKYAFDLTADYVLSQRLNIQFYLSHDLNNPYVTMYYRNSETEFGFSLRMSL
ncbi:MAG: cell surface protein SprA [Bacteroidales bacterium]|nr:cell surface protein SprA [Bacteroidales bacterium]